MKKNSWGFLCLCGLLAVSLWAGDRDIPIVNAGFEAVVAGSLPEGWKSEVLGDGAGLRSQIDSQQNHGGNDSLKISHERWGQSVWTSAPLDLQVGQLYRASAWLKCANVRTDGAERYPTPVAACLTMASFPFTNHSPAAGGSGDWRKIEMLFIATQRRDCIRLHLGYNGPAEGTAWFDDISLAEVADISEFIPVQTVRWFGPAFRCSDRGWTFVHVEGGPYQRGYQHGVLLAEEICAYMEKLALRDNLSDPAAAWRQLTQLTDALLLRRFEEEYLTEMKGIADGIAHAGVIPKFRKEKVDLLDIVTLNSVVDLGQMTSALYRTAQPLSGASFLSAEDELLKNERLHKCSSFLANGPATADGRIVFGQMFMWNGYTGVHWHVVLDLQPDTGQRLVFETFPGGIHSAADFYINAAGIMIGETTVQQTPYKEGIPQSDRIRKAAQYARSIDDVCRILITGNNGLYTNDWLIGNSKTDETAILLLGTNKHKLWRSRSGDFPGNTPGFFWSVNATKDPEVRKEYIANPANAPFDLAYNPSNRDIAFINYYRQTRGKINVPNGARVMASSPINRPHACDGKITSSEMAERLVFWGHFGKVTLREKFPDKNIRYMPDLPGATPHLTLGYSAFSPIFVTEKMKEMRARNQQMPTASSTPETNLSAAENVYLFPACTMWQNTVFPESEADNWFASASAAYWNALNSLGTDGKANCSLLADQLAEMSCRLQYVTAREGALVPRNCRRQYDRYGSYQFPRLRGTFLLHQLRLCLGNETFAKVMSEVHSRFREKALSTGKFVALAETVSGKKLASFIGQWLDRSDLPELRLQAKLEQTVAGWKAHLEIEQSGVPFHFFTTIAIACEKSLTWQVVEVADARQAIAISCAQKPLRLIFNAGNDVPLPRHNFYTMANLFDDFAQARIVYGTSRQIEANHTLALRYQTMLADTFTEALIPVRKDSELAETDQKDCDLVILGGVADNALTGEMAGKLGIVAGKNWFSWQGRIYGESDEGLCVVYPNPFNPQRVVYLVLANSALQLYQMTKAHQGYPSWALFKGDRVVAKGFHPSSELAVQ